MKKIYVSPETVLQEVKLTQMVAVSNQTPDNFTFDPETEASNGNGEILSRRSGIWDDED